MRLDKRLVWLYRHRSKEKAQDKTEWNMTNPRRSLANGRIIRCQVFMRSHCCNDAENPTFSLCFSQTTCKTPLIWWKFYTKWISWKNNPAPVWRRFNCRTTPRPEFDAWWWFIASWILSLRMGMIRHASDCYVVRIFVNCSILRAHSLIRWPLP